METNGRNGMDRFYRQTINALVAAQAERDSMAEAHSDRVRTYSTAMAERIEGLTAQNIKDIGYAASLHDIGKVAVSGRILNKLGRLTEEEFKIMRQHSLVATRILDKVEGLQNAIPMIRHHHERYDGKGYPDGLAGEDIPIGARIVAVAETFDILTSDVPWRGAMTREEALAEVLRCSGTQFDPKVVDVLRETLEDMSVVIG